MPTFVTSIQNRQIIIEAWASAGPPSDENPPQISDALVDTGAQLSMVSPGVVSGLDLDAAGVMLVAGVNGKAEETDFYIMRISVPVQAGPSESGKRHIHFAGVDLKVGVFPPAWKGQDILLGMDFLTRFHITMHRDTVIFSI